MFKKFASIAIAALLVGSTAVVASAAEADIGTVPPAEQYPWRVCGNGYH